jgi:diadenosine tetraphosphate (Ap4A) HIT family hydrolase
MDHFQIHAQLLADCHRLGRFDFCHVLLNKNAALPWFILVPETSATDLLELSVEQRNAALNEAAALARFVKQELGYPKVNFAAIGNVVPQLHLHVVGRKPQDICWPAPVWGHLGDGPAYPAARLADWVDALVRDYSLRRP